MRMNPALRKTQIMNNAIMLAERHGYTHVTREAVAEAAGVAPSLVSKYWGTMAQLQRAIMRQAISQGNTTILAQGLAARDRNAMKAPDELKEEAIKSLKA